ncbi:MAG: hypothetical protein ACI9FN_002440 [Saprospiraceae bacterium]|jgi:hypothetical protein
MILHLVRMTILICFSFVFTLSGQVEENIFRCRSEIKYYHPIDLSKTGELNQIFELSNFQDHSPLYSYIEIYLDSEGNKTIEEIRKNDEIWQVNRTAREFFSNKVYWVKIEFESKKQREGLIINLSPNDWDQSWNTIDSWTLLEDSIINYNRTGWNISNHEKPVASPLNLIELPQVEGDQINLILRLEGIPEGKNRIPELINFWVLNSKNYPGLTSGYHLPGKFVSSESTNFTHSPIINTELWIDPVGDATIDVVEYSWNSHKTSDIFQTPHLPNTVYWMKTSFIGNETFFGEQMLHISSRPRWGGLDFFSFDHVDAYYIHKSGKRIHQTSGDHVALTQRPYNHWPNFLRLDIALNDTIDLYIRMEGADRRFLMSHICLYQIEKSSVYPDQLGLARSEGFFYGVLIIQILFFSVLYLIGKERTHGCFTLVAIGLFLVLGFSEDNFHVFVNFPTLRDYHVPLFFIGTFILSTGIISFAKEYFRIIMSTVWRKTLYLFLISCAFINCYAIYKFEYTLEFGNPATQLYVQLAIIFVMLSIVIGLCIAIFSVQRKGVSKKLYLLAFLPISIVGIIHWVRVLGMYMWGLELSIDHLVGISNINLIRIAIVSMLTLFALSIGSRINRLKEEKKWHYN